MHDRIAGDGGGRNRNGTVVVSVALMIFRFGLTRLRWLGRMVQELLLLEEELKYRKALLSLSRRLMLGTFFC